MATLYTKVKLHLDANSKTWDDTAIVLQNDGSGDYIEGRVLANVNTGSPRVNGENVYTMMNVMLVSTT